MNRELKLKELQLMDATRRKFLEYQQQQKEMELARMDDEIRRKVSCYLQTHIDLSPQVSKQTIGGKKTKAPVAKEYPSLKSLNELLQQEKSVYHLFKEKINNKQDECAYCNLNVM